MLLGRISVAQLLQIQRNIKSLQGCWCEFKLSLIVVQKIIAYKISLPNLRLYSKWFTRTTLASNVIQFIIQNKAVSAVHMQYRATGWGLIIAKNRHGWIHKDDVAKSLIRPSRLLWKNKFDDNLFLTSLFLSYSENITYLNKFFTFVHFVLFLWCNTKTCFIAVEMSRLILKYLILNDLFLILHLFRWRNFEPTEVNTDRNC